MWRSPLRGRFELQPGSASANAASIVSPSVVMFAPMMYGMMSSRFTYFLETSGTKTVNATDTDIVMSATSDPKANIGHFARNHASRFSSDR